MYKVLVVEDMDLTRDDILHLIDWEKHGFELLPDARNGKIGLEYARRYQPDIVITDIKMPVMTGLDMVDALMKLEKKPAVILLTAYEEFELAKRALQMGIQTFMLKYEIDEEVLLRELNRCVEGLKRQKNIEELRLRQKLRYIMKGNFEALSGEENILGWKGGASLFFLQIPSLDKQEILNEEKIQDILEQNIEAEKFRVVYIRERGLVIFRKDRVYLSEAQNRDSAKHFAALVQKAIEEEFRKHVIIAVGGSIKGNKDIPVCWQRAERIMQGYVFEKGSCILENPPEEEKRNMSMSLKENLQEIETSMDNRNFGQALEYLYKIRSELVRSRNIYWHKKILNRLMYILEENSLEAEQKEAEEKAGLLKEEYGRMTIFEFCKQFEEIANILEEEERDRFSGKIRHAKAYIREHYAQDISLNELADYLGMNPMYLSRLFKKEMGTNFSAYLTKVRIEKAIELLKQGDYKIYEISQMVGYQTVQYFSKVFKKETGKSPKDFY